MEISLKYVDEDDKCYGRTGMAVSMVVWDCENLLSAISLDACADKVVEFTPDFYFSGNPRLSPKLAWKQILENFQVSISMLISNVVCRNYMSKGVALNSDTKRLLYKHIEDEARETCSLERDEIEHMFNKSYDYIERIFSHHAVQNIVREFADTLKQQRRLTRAEVIENLQALNML